jgi:hypothetical protein
MEIKTLIERVRRLFLEPNETWESIKLEPVTVSDLLREYILKLAAVPAAAHFLGWWAVTGFWTSVTRSLLLYFLAVAAVWSTSKAIFLLAPQFGAEDDELKAFKLATFSLTPYFLSGVFYLIPPLMVFVPLGGMFGVYLLYKGLPVVMEIPTAKAQSYAAMVSIAMFLTFLIIGKLTGGVIHWH